MKIQNQITNRGRTILTAFVLYGVMTSAAFAGDWTDGTLSFIQGLNHDGNARSAPLSQVELMMKGGKTFAVDPKLTIVDKSGHALTIDQVTTPSKVRFRADENVIKELKVLEALPR